MRFISFLLKLLIEVPRNLNAEGIHVLWPAHLLTIRPVLTPDDVEGTQWVSLKHRSLVTVHVFVSVRHLSWFKDSALHLCF